MRVVIADDFTGAAEIAGAAWRFGFAATVQRGDGPPDIRGDLRVIDADYRHLPTEEASSRVETLVRSLAGAEPYLKIDSVLRGAFGAGVGAALRATGRPRAVVAPQNPARGRVIVGGRYLIDGRPLDQTDFARDPGHPVATADVRARVGGDAADHRVFSSDATDKLAAGIHIANGASAADLDRWAARLDAATLAVGGVAFFEAILRRETGHETPPPGMPRRRGPRLFLCGSASATTRDFVIARERAGSAVFAVPLDPGDTRWTKDARAALARDGQTFLHVPPPVDPARARGIERAMGAAAGAILGSTGDADLFVEGGSTAAAVADALGWSAFTVGGEWAPGIVQLLPVADPRRSLTVKPGSYTWPAAVFG